MGKVRRGAFTALGWTAWKAGSKLGWRYAKGKVRERESAQQRQTAAAERSADAAERTADAAERSASRRD